MDAATKKVMIQKNFDCDAEQKKINLHAVSASCPVMNLQRNNYNSLYLKANQLSNHMQVNKQRIRHYLRENPNLQLRTLQQLEDAFLKADKQRTGQITRKTFILKLAKNNISVSQHLLNNMMYDMQLNPSEEATDETILVYKHLVDIIDIF